MRFSCFVAAQVLSLALLTPSYAAPAQDQTNAADADSRAIQRVLADFSGNFSLHDAHAAALTFAEDADFTNMRGNHSHGRKDIENWLASLFRGILKDAKRTDTVRSIRFFSPELADVDADTVITGTKAPDGSELAPRKGLMIVTMTKQNGQWRISTFHEAEFPEARGGTASAPANHSMN